MSKFLILWKLDLSRVPESPEEQMAYYSRLLNMVKGDLNNIMVDWGEFPGSNKGYAISEGTEQEIDLALMKYCPYVKFKVHPTVSVSQIEENIKTLSQM